MPRQACTLQQDGDMRASKHVIIGGIAAALVVALAGCTAGVGATDGAGAAEPELLEQAAALAQDVGFVSQSIGLERPEDAIAAYARRATQELPATGVPDRGNTSDWGPVPDTATPFRLVAIEPESDAAWEEPVGALVLASRITEVSANDDPEHDFCVRLRFDRWGVIDGGVEKTSCPDPLVEVEPPADERPVVPEAAEAVAIEVLTGAGDASADELEASITARLAGETDGRALAPVEVLRDGDRLGLAMRDADDCLLVRSADGVVERLHVSDVLLQDGELGCGADTALLADDQFPTTH